MQLVQNTEAGGLQDNTRTDNDLPCILHMNSVSHLHEAVIPRLRDYLNMEHIRRKSGCDVSWLAQNGGKPPALSEEERRILISAPKRFTPESIPTVVTINPKQDNCYDCGVYTFKFVDKFVDNMPVRSTHQIIQNKFEEVIHAGSFNTTSDILKARLQLAKFLMNESVKYKTYRNVVNAKEVAERERLKKQNMKRKSGQFGSINI